MQKQLQSKLETNERANSKWGKANQNKTYKQNKTKQKNKLKQNKTNKTKQNKNIYNFSNNLKRQ